MARGFKACSSQLVAHSSQLMARCYQPGANCSQQSYNASKVPHRYAVQGSDTTMPPKAASLFGQKKHFENDELTDDCQPGLKRIED